VRSAARALVLLVLVANVLHAAAETTTSPVNIIFDTDMGSDCDDAGAMAVLHTLADRGEANILAVIFSSGRNPYGVGVCDAINTYYGRGNLPLGQYKKDDVGDPRDSFSRVVATNTKTYGHDIVSTAPDLLEVYKKVLEKQPDNSVTMVTVGHPHALSHLIDDPAGLNLVRLKVVRCISMAGAPDTPQNEWNFCQPGMEKYVANVLKNWPTPHYFSPAGEEVITGNRKLPDTPRENPVREVYKHYNDALHKGRSSWDQLAVLAAVRPHLFHQTRGVLKQDDQYRLLWMSAETTARQYRVTPKLGKPEMELLVEDLMAAPRIRN